MIEGEALDQMSLPDQAFMIYLGAYAFGIMIGLLIKALEEDQSQNEN